MNIDRLKYKVFFRVWRFWHSDLRMFKPFMRYIPAKDYGTLFNGRHIVDSPRYELILDNRPCWHLCCNGDSGGWRTDLCIWLENKWRETDYYQKGD